MSELQAPTKMIAGSDADPRWIVLRVSRINLALSAGGALVAFPLLAWVPGLPLWLRIAIMAAFVVTLGIDLWLILRKNRQAVMAFHLLDLGSNPADPFGPKLGIRLRRRADEAQGTVLRQGFVSPWFTALRYRLPQDPAWRRWLPHVLPLWKDSLDAEAFRQVRVALRWK